jgi:hypothetical protein
MSELQTLFNQLHSELAVYQPPLQPKYDTDSAYDLWSIKEAFFAGRKRKEVYFAGLTIRKDFVGFYYMPVYAEPEIKALFKPELLKLLKGKACFHIKRLDDDLLIQIREALEKGYKLYQERGWV